MSKVSLGGSPTGTATFDIVAPATNTNRTITLPDASGQISVLDLRAAQAATGTAVDFLNIPATARRVTVMFNGVSTNGASQIQVQVGSGSISASGYVGTSGTNTSINTGIPFAVAGAANVANGILMFVLLEANTFVANGMCNFSNTGGVASSAGITPSLSGSLDRIRITTVNGTDVFDAGSISVMVE